MRMSALIGAPASPDPEITGITADSREVQSGFLFAALPGSAVDGAKFIASAEAAGAAAVLAMPGVKSSLPVIEDPEPRRKLSEIAARFYPQQSSIIAGVTGTNGKTSTALFAADLWRLLGRASGSIGTLGARSEAYQRKLVHTTPEPVTLHATLDAMTRSGVDRLAMEVSSHALSQFRADGVRFSLAAFTNLTQDHLDYHASFDAYMQAKLRLFKELVNEEGAAIINMDGECANAFKDASTIRGLRILTTGRNGEDLRLLDAVPHPAGLDLKIRANHTAFEIALPLIGAFQAENALLAAGIVIASGEETQSVLEHLPDLSGVPGRMQHVASVGGAGIYVDYAHTPDAIATALAAVRPHARGRVIAIIGAGGDRDRTKRALMGHAAQQGADIVIVTDDNPRTEDPAAIRAEVLRGMTDAREVGDRQEAIAIGVAALQQGDVLLIAGKGHETGQIVGDKTLPFDDAEVAGRMAAKREESGR